MRCDSHVHVVGVAERYPQLGSRDHHLSVAALSTLRRLGASRDISRFVIVQPSFYGADNSALLDALDALGGLGRGVVVLDPERQDNAMLAGWDKRGVRGLRVNLYSLLGRPKSFERGFMPMMKIASALDWHVEVIASIQMLGDHAALIAAAQAPVVIDHYGVFGACAPDSGEGRKLLDLLGLPHVWIKLSAPYRVAKNPLETQPPAAWLAAILDCAGERCVWGSDWPHTPPHDPHAGTAYRQIPYAALIDDFLAALKSPALANAVLRENPARLYGYPDSD